MDNYLILKFDSSDREGIDSNTKYLSQKVRNSLTVIARGLDSKWSCRVLSILVATCLNTQKQISRLQSRPLAFVRMCLKAALTAKRLICKKTLAGCDGSISQ